MRDFVQPIVQVQPNGLYRLVEPYSYTNRNFSFVIPPGFEWDGASVPRLFWSVSGIRPGGRFLGPSLIHDALYRAGGVLHPAWVVPLGNWTRFQVDNLFRTMMKQAGIGWMQYHRAYWAVRTFSAFAWKAR